MIDRYLQLMSNNTVNGTLFNCHKCTRYLHLIPTFHEIDFATILPTVLFTRNRLEVYFICYFILLQMSIYTYTYFGRNWLKNKLNISQSVALGVWWLTADKALVWAVTLNLIFHNQTVYLGLPSINFVCKNPNQNVLLFYRVEICY